MSDSYTSSSYYYSSTTNTTDGTTTTGHRYTTTSHTNPEGTTIVRTAHQDLGQPAIIEERRYDRTGQEQIAPVGVEASHAGGVRRITELDDETGSSYEAGTAYGLPSTGTTGGALESVADQVQAGDEADRVTYDTRSAFGARAYDPFTGAYDMTPAVDSDGVNRQRERHHHRVQGRCHGRDKTGYYANDAGGGGRRVEFEVPETGARLRRESDVDMSKHI